MSFLFKRSNGIYYYVNTINGKQVWRSTGARSRAEAEKVHAKTTHDGPSAKELTLVDFIPQFQSYAETNLAPTTVLLYQQAAKVFIRIIGNYPLSAYRVQQVEIFKAQRSKEVSSVKVNIDFRTLRALFETALRWNLIEKNPFRGIKQIRIPQQQPAYLTKGEFSQLMEVVDMPWFKNLIIFAVCTMMRAGEIVTLTWDSVDLGRRLIFVRNTDEFRTKTSKTRTVPMNEWVINLLLTRPTKNGRIFTFPNGEALSVPYVSHRFKKYVNKAGLPFKIHFHSLRHTGASWLVQDGVSIYAVQKILGHSSVVTTQIYSHMEVEGLFPSVNRISAFLPQSNVFA
jgi:integrase